MAYYYDRNCHIQNDLRTARKRNRTRGATRKLLFIKHLTKIRVVVFATLKMLNILTHNQLHGARLSTANLVNLVDENLVLILFC